jgi:hypothetical protein
MPSERAVWSGKRVMERWGIYSTELAGYILSGLPAYQIIEGRIELMPPEDIGRINEDAMTDLLFDPADVKKFEEKNEINNVTEDNEADLPPEDRRRIGLLERQVQKREAAIGVAVKVGLHFANEDREITRDELKDKVYGIDRSVSNELIEIIWHALPDNKKKAPGRPRKG